MNLLLIEDESLTAEDLKETLLELDPNIRILAILPSVRQAVNYLKENKENIHLIFSDIQLQDGLSFEIFQSVAITIPVVFCTAYNEYALRAFDANGIDYILKPFSSESVEKALLKYRHLQHSLSKGIDIYEKVVALLEQQKPQRSGSILVHHKDKIIPISIGDVAVFYMQHEVVHLLSFDQKTYTVSYTMEEVEKKVGDNFFRANRQFLVNRKAVRDASQHFARKMLLHLNLPFAEEILVSKLRVQAFLEWLEL